MRTLLIDNHDSFTYNLFHLLGEVNGAEPLVVRNDEASWEELAGLAPDNIVLSAGPGRPQRAADFGVCAEVLRRAELPILGVCLGHQGLGWIAGAEVVRAPAPVHGGIVGIRHAGGPLFAGIPPEFQAVRYHSLCLAEPLPPDLEPIAWAEDGVLMGIAHRRLPRWGVQFHPESVATEHGRRLLANFRDLSSTRSPRRLARSFRGVEQTRQRVEAPLRLRLRVIEGDSDPERAFERLCGGVGDAFWLDSRRIGDGARFSFVGTPGPLGSSLSYDVASGELRLRGAGGEEVRRESVFDHLAAELRRLRLPKEDTADLPFGFTGGFVGWLGYELKAETGGRAAHAAPTADAAFLFVDRLVAFDHEDGRTYLLCLVDRAAGPGAPGGAVDAERWLEATADLLEVPREASRPAPEPPSWPAPEFALARTERRYLEEIAACRRAFEEGESYEICLTNQVRTAWDGDPLALYRRLRRLNPAPYAALLRIGPTAVLSSSPERFLRIGADGGVEAKPIKGTVRRDPDPVADAVLAGGLGIDPKNRAENLMIVDLLRNDLGRVCALGSVEVPRLMAVESFETVHQMVSTIRGRLRDGTSAVDCIRSCFPPGSMTGAPKERTMDILDRLEGAARGVYSGAIGYLGLGGECDLAVAIRTIVLAGGEARIGAGGAIVLASDSEQEVDEMLLKAWAPMRALDSSLPEDYSRSRFGASMPRVTPRRSSTSAASATTAP